MMHCIAKARGADRRIYAAYVDTVPDCAEVHWREGRTTRVQPLTLIPPRAEPTASGQLVWVSSSTTVVFPPELAERMGDGAIRHLSSYINEALRAGGTPR